MAKLHSEIVCFLWKEEKMVTGARKGIENGVLWPYNAFNPDEIDGKRPPSDEIP